MNYGGHYRASRERSRRRRRAEGLDLVCYNLIVNKEQRIPDIARFDRRRRSLDGVWLLHAQEYHSSYWGHLGLLGLDDHLLLPGFSAYRATALASPWSHERGDRRPRRTRSTRWCGYVHPFDGTCPTPRRDEHLATRCRRTSRSARSTTTRSWASPTPRLGRRLAPPAQPRLPPAGRRRHRRDERTTRACAARVA
jgi:hypothetical protein